MTPLQTGNALDVHGWLQSHEGRTAGKSANAPPNLISSESDRPTWRLITNDGICTWVRDDGVRVKPIQPFCAPKTEQEIVELSCAPQAYHHCVDFLWEAPKGFFTFDELTKPEKWPQAVSKYLALTGQGELSLAANQLHRLLEEARKDFREAQDRAWHNRKLADRPPEDYYRKEAAAWEKFSKVKQVLLQQYNRAIKSGVVKRVKRKKARVCPMCNKEPLRPRQRKCDECRRATRRKRNRRYYEVSRDSFKTGSLLGITPPNPGIPLLPPSHSQQDALTVLKT